MAHEFATVVRDDHVLTVTINRPERMNALHPPANAELAEIFDGFAADPDLWVAIITGAGERAFSAGNDLRWQAEGNAITVPATGFAGLTSRWDCDKPVIAAVNGVAMGGGFEVALAADIILAADTATFALPEPKVGLAALAGGLHRLPRAIGVSRAMAMILTARTVSAAEGKALGFVHDVVPAADLMAAAQALAAQMCALSPLSLRASKQALLAGLSEASVQAAYENQGKYPAVGALFRSEDLREGPLAFAQKRKPEWKGR
ncbi:enoyl-CoA hydratase-related protein [Sandarakinorhabdus sp.]|uniref:enoyl-CoA hydratase-related protein n=1 Tax=Sandarakinorhabdus sp. TaxID=1916663 RepID=UPI00286E5516|nr:enoyl-CoA hydratase-related protein [Sandarakinorhabdus sp.]